MPEDSLDIEFSVPYVHRLRVTEDVAGKDFASLIGVLGSGGGDGGAAKVLVVAETSVAEASQRVDRIMGKLQRSDAVQVVAPVLLVAGGEAIKNSDDAVRRLLSAVNQHNLDRRSFVIAIGGGAMLDAVGYAAAISHRGVRLVRLPTTTLAQADSGVGVKNSINHFGKKNWVGTFAVPWAVINDASLLDTLPDREFRCGFSEAIKVALLKDRDEFDWLCQHADDIRGRRMSFATRAIGRACTLHLRHITEGGDPFEMLEARPLDFGHWSAHKLEPLSNYEVRHGEAVAIGVAIDCLYSSIKFGFPEEDAMKVCTGLSRLGMPLWHKEVHPVDRLMHGLEEFRQHLGGRLTITMLRGVADPIQVHEIDFAAMNAAIERLRLVAEKLALESGVVRPPEVTMQKSR